MVEIGGRWVGKNIRNITYRGFACASMPRKDSFASAKIKIEKGKLYEVEVIACGNSRVEINIGSLHTHKIFVAATDFSSFKFKIDALNHPTKSTDILIKKDSKHFGNLYLHKILIREISRPIIISDADKQNDIKKEKEARRNKISQIQSEMERLYRAQHNEYLLISRGEKMGTTNTIGGPGYMWKGKGIKSSVKYGQNCALLQRPGSLLLMPAEVGPNLSYKIDIFGNGTARGNGHMLVNFFAGKKYDGEQKLVQIIGDHLSSTTIEVKTPPFPSGAKLYLRVWRPSSATGPVTIKEIKYTQVKTKTPEPIKNPTRHEAKRPEPKKYVKPKEKVTNHMKIRPFKFNASKAAEKVREVVIDDKTKVPMVSIITPTRDGVALLKRCYESLVLNTMYPNWEWIVGDSASQDGTSEYINGLKDPRVKFIERGTTDGSFSSINNELAKKASGEYYLFLNNDTEPQKFWLYEMMSKICRYPDIGIVGARLMYNSKKVQHAGIMFIPQGPINIGRDVLPALGDKEFYEQDRFLQAITGACLLISAKDFNAVGGFDPIYYFCYEDVDLCLKVRAKLKKKILYAANAVLLHAESVTQKKYKTGGSRQKVGIDEFKRRWMNKIDIDFPKHRKDRSIGVFKKDITFVTCVNNLEQYSSYVVGSLFKTDSARNYEIIPVLNFDNIHSAASALNYGIDEARGDLVVLCHQDIIFYKEWIDMLYTRISEIENKDRKWGVLGTAGITHRKDKTIGVVHNLRGTLQWQQTIKARMYPVQTVDEHCMIIKKRRGLRFDQGTFNGFHCYGPDICLNALSRGMRNYGILCPLVHDSASGSLRSGRHEFMRLLNALAGKWRSKFPVIRTTTSRVTGKKVTTFIKFKK